MSVFSFSPEFTNCAPARILPDETSSAPVGIFLAAFFVSLFQVCSFDIFWHLKTGLVMFEEQGRLQAYPAEFMAQFNSQFSQGEWPGLLRKYGVNTALVNLPALNTLFSADEWGMVFWDDRRAILVRRGGSRDELLRHLECRLFTPGADLDSYDGKSLPHLIAEMERNQEERLEESPLLGRDLEETRKRLRELQGP